MSIAFRMFEHLLPRSKTWRLLLGKQLREFFEGLANGVPTDLIAKADARYTDVQPLQTLQLDDWDFQFGLPLSGGLTETERRVRLVGAWRNTGGQGKLYLEQVLRDHGFPGVFFHEFWEPDLTTFATETILTEDDLGNATNLTLPPDPTTTEMNIGHLGGDFKVTVLARFALNIPKGARIVAAELRVTTTGVFAGATPGGTTRVGLYEKDGKWDSPPGFDNPPYNLLTEVPDPTASGTSDITPGVMRLNRFIPGAELPWDDTVPADTIFSIGHESFDPTAVCDLAGEIQAHIDGVSYDPATAPYIGFVWDDASASEDLNRYLVYSSTHATGEGPTLTIIWEPVAVQPLTVKNPNTYLADGGPIDSTCCDESLMECGEATALCGETVGVRGFLLVNIVEQSTTIFLGCGDPVMECDEALALCGEAFSVTFNRLPYLIPSDVDEWRYILYVGAKVWPQVASVDLARQEEFESLLLRICPGQQWLGMLVDYV